MIEAKVAMTHVLEHVSLYHVVAFAFRASFMLYPWEGGRKGGRRREWEGGKRRVGGRKGEREGEKGGREKWRAASAITEAIASPYVCVCVCV